jgi:pimeloyl-ACP methyl ester carboxylesterase
MRGTELHIPLRNLTLAARTWGERSDPPILALHGWLDNAASFERLAPLLEGRFVVALDLAGHGQSAHRPPGNWYAYVDYLDEIGEVIDWFGWTTIDLLGHSLGATLASVYAALRPERIARLLLIEGLGPLSAPIGATLEQLRRSHAARAAFRGGKLRVFVDIETAVRARQGSSALSWEGAHCLVERGIKAVHGGYSWSSDPRLTLPSSLRLSEEQLAVILAGIEASTLLVLAQPEAPYLSRAMMEARIALLKSIQVVRLDGTHHLHLEDPGPVASAINDFLAAG